MKECFCVLVCLAIFQQLSLLHAQINAPALTNEGGKNEQADLLQIYASEIQKGQEKIRYDYSGALNILCLEYQNAGDLSETLAIKAELERYFREKLLTESNLVKEPEKLRNIQHKYSHLLDDVRVNIVKDMVVKTKLNVRELTKQGRLDEAKALDDQLKRAAEIYREELTVKNPETLSSKDSISNKNEAGAGGSYAQRDAEKSDSMEKTVNLPPEFSSISAEDVYNAYTENYKSADGHFKNHRFNLSGVIDVFENSPQYVGRVLLYLRCPGRGYRVAVIVHGHNAILRMGAISFGGYDKGQYYTFNDAFCQELRGSTVGFVASEVDGNKSQSRNRKNNWNN